jgi:hypothetical protein
MEKKPGSAGPVAVVQRRSESHLAHGWSGPVARDHGIHDDPRPTSCMAGFVHANPGAAVTWTWSFRSVMSGCPFRDRILRNAILCYPILSQDRYRVAQSKTEARVRSYSMVIRGYNGSAGSPVHVDGSLAPL